MGPDGPLPQQHRKWGLNKQNGLKQSVFELVGVCVYAGKTVVGPSFMNGNRAFVISSPYLVTGLYRGKALFMQLRIKCGSETRGRYSKALPSRQMYCLLAAITHEFAGYCCIFGITSAKCLTQLTVQSGDASKHPGRSTSWLFSGDEGVMLALRL